MKDKRKAKSVRILDEAFVKRLEAIRVASDFYETYRGLKRW